MKKEIDAKLNSSNLQKIALVFFAGLFYLYYPQLQNYSTTPKWIFVAFSGILLFFLGKKQRIPWSNAFSWWFVFVGFYLLSCFWSYNFWDSLVRAIPWVLAPLSVVLLRREEDDLTVFYSKIASVISILILPFLLITLLEISGLYLSEEYNHLATYQFRFTFGNRNQFCELLALIVPLLTVGVFYSNKKWQKRFFYLVIFLIYLTATLLMNRAVILVLYGVYPISLVLLYLQKREGSKRKKAYAGLFLLLMLGLTVVASPLRKKIPVLKNILETGYGSGNERIRIWSNSIDLWKEEPVFGQGSGDWKIEILKTPLEFTKASESTVFYQRAHNDFIQVLVENGIFGLLLFTVFFILGLRSIFKSNLEKPAKILMAAGVVAYLLISNFSFPIEKVELLLLLFLFLAPGLKMNKIFSKPLDQHKVTFFLVFVLCSILSISWIGKEKAYFQFKKDNDLLAFADIDKNYYSIDPTSTPLFWNEGNNFYNKGNYNQALTNYKNALRYNPYHVHVLNNIGSSYYALQNIQQAELYFNQALAYNPKFVETLMNYSSLLFNKGEIDAAILKILSVPQEREPQNYKMFLLAITKAKYQLMIEKHDEPTFKNFLLQTIQDDTFLYEISKKCRQSNRSYEMELRHYLATTKRK